MFFCGNNYQGGIKFMITKQISLYVWKANNTIIYANKGEVDCRYIETSFKDEKQSNISLANCEVIFYARKPDGTTIFNQCTVDSSKNTATAELTSQALSVSGILDCEFQIFDSNNVLLKVTGLKIFVSDSKDFSEAIESTSEFNVITSLVNDVKTISSNLGNLNNLTTTEKSAIVGAINELNAKTIPLSQGGTGASTAENARNNLGIPATVLYSNTSGTTGTIELSQPYTNFVRIGVYAQGQYDNDSTYNEMLTTVSYLTLSATSAADNTHNCTVWRAAFINFSGNTVTFDTNCSSAYTKSTGYDISTGDGLKITKVVGYTY